MLAVNVWGRAANFHTWNLDGIASASAAAADDDDDLAMVMVMVGFGLVHSLLFVAGGCCLDSRSFCL